MEDISYPKRNLSTKALLQLISFILASALWFYVISSEPLEVEKKLPLEFITPDGFSVSNLVEREAVIRLKGPRVFLRNLFDPKDRIYINLNRYQYQLGKSFTVLLDESDIPIPLGVKIIEIRPTEVLVSLDKLVSKKIQVMPALVGEIPAELKLISSHVSPRYVWINGPRNVVKKMEKIFTGPIDVSLLQGEGVLKVSLEELDPRVKTKERGEVDFKFELRPKKANFTLKNIKVRFLSSQRKIKANIEAVAIDVLVPEDREALRESEVQVVADIPEGAQGKSLIKLKAILPDGIHLLRIHPEAINIEVLSAK